MSSEGVSQSSDRPLMDLVRRVGPISVEDLADRMAVTPTASRVRLSRLVESGLIERVQESVGRGRPKFLYQASPLAQRKLGQNYADLALVLWDEVMHSVGDPKIRRELFARITDRLAESYSGQMRGEEWSSRLVQLGGLLHQRGVETEVSADEAAHHRGIVHNENPYGLNNRSDLRTEHGHGAIQNLQTDIII